MRQHQTNLSFNYLNFFLSSTAILLVFWPYRNLPKPAVVVGVVFRCVASLQVALSLAHSITNVTLPGYNITGILFSMQHILKHIAKMKILAPAQKKLNATNPSVLFCEKLVCEWVVCSSGLRHQCPGTCFFCTTRGWVGACVGEGGAAGVHPPTSWLPALLPAPRYR